ncbi:zinc ribbon domain-containing protein [Acidobacteriia bacterium AH_259_A11_L15]|nr:zinc ribbon domain-containing protein [Acidobacteriia bacterium AH_259_A11_L15]
MICCNCQKDILAGSRHCYHCGAAQKPPTPEPLPVIGVGSSYGHGWRQLWKHFLMLFLIGIIFVLISFASAMFNIGQQSGGAGAAVLGILSLAYGIFLTNPIDYGVSFAFLKAARNDPLDIKDMFEAFHNYWNAVLASLLVTVIIGLGFVLLIVPGIIFACKL